ncbi:MAG: hypothetical protein ACO1SX_27550 [Actinomycetota bacterium]
MRCAKALILASFLSVSLMGHALAQEPAPQTPGGAAPDRAVGAGDGPASPPAGSPREAPAPAQKFARPVVGAGLQSSTPVVKPSPTPAPLETPAPAPASPANEPSVLPPTGVPVIPEPEPQASPQLDIPDTGPGSINQPLISRASDPEPTPEEQPVPVRELSLFFGMTLLLAVGYLTFTARTPEVEEGPSG